MKKPERKKDSKSEKEVEAMRERIERDKEMIAKMKKRLREEFGIHREIGYEEPD